MKLIELGNYLKEKYNWKEGMLFREGPSHVRKDLRFDVVVEGVLDGKRVFVKGYTDNSKEYYQFELDFTNKINEYSNNNPDSYISGTRILEYNDEYQYFVMDAITQPKVDIHSLTTEESLLLQNRITDFFSGLRRGYELGYFVGRHEKDKYADLVKYFEGRQSIEEEGVRQLFAGMVKLLKSWIDNGENFGFVSNIISYNKQQILDKIDSFAGNVKLKNALCDSIGILWDGHVYGSVHGKLTLIDFDRLIPSLNGYDFTALLFGNIGLNTYVYSDFEEYRSHFFEVKGLLENVVRDSNLVSFLLLQKLIGTVFNDYGWLLLERNNHLEKFASLGIDPKENSKRGIEWNFKIMNTLFGITYNLK